MTSHKTRGQRLQRSGLLPVKLPRPIDPALAKHAEERASKTQNRIADRITRFSGSMAFVYVHIVWFSTWIGLGVEKYPFGLLTMIVSLEAIFLSTFVMISQNRADAKHQVIVDEQWSTVKEEDRQNRELLDLSSRSSTSPRPCMPPRATLAAGPTATTPPPTTRAGEADPPKRRRGGEATINADPTLAR